MRLSEERYISLLTDFGFKQELREYEDSLKAYRDIKNRSILRRKKAE
jgi:hypothetical protein